MKPMGFAKTIKILALLSAAPLAAEGAQETIKVGLVAEFSGPFARYGTQMHNGMKAYMKQHGDTVAGKKVEIILRDTTGPSPDIAKRLTRDALVLERGRV